MFESQRGYIQDGENVQSMEKESTECFNRLKIEEETPAPRVSFNSKFFLSFFSFFRRAKIMK